MVGGSEPVVMLVEQDARLGYWGPDIQFSHGIWETINKVKNLPKYI